MRTTLLSSVVIGTTFALLTAGCSSSGTSSAGFTSDEDAYQAHGPAGMVDEAPAPTAVASNTNIFHTSGTVYGTTSFPEAGGGNLEVLSPSLNNRLAVNHVKSHRTDSNLLAVSAALKNSSSHDLPLQVETVYRDKHGLMINSHASWVPLTLKPGEETEYRSVSITDDANDYLVRIRRAPAD